MRCLFYNEDVFAGRALSRHLFNKANKFVFPILWGLFWWLTIFLLKTLTSSQSSLKRTQQDSLSQSPKRGRPARTPAVSLPIRKLLSQSTLSASVQPASLPVQDPRSGARPNTRTLRPKQSTICAAKQVLIKDYESRKTAASFFPPTLSNHTTRIAIGRFQSHVDNVLANIKDVGANCGLFIVSGNLQRLHHYHPTLLAALESRMLESDDLARSSVCLCSYRSWIQPSSFFLLDIQRSGLTIWESKKNVLLPILIGYEPGAGHLSFLENYTSNITITSWSNYPSLRTQPIAQILLQQTKLVTEP